MSRQKDKGRLPPFVPLLKETMSAPAWRAMSHGARSLYAVLKQRYSSNFKNNGRIYLSTRAAAEDLGSHSHRKIVRRWFRELQYYGFIVLTDPGCLGVEGKGKAPRWRLTELGCMADPPTRDFLRWDGVAFHELKPPRYRTDFIRPKKQNPGTPVCPTVGHPSAPVLGHPSAPPTRRSGTPVCPIQPDPPGTPVCPITSLTTPHLESSDASAEVERSPGLPWTTPAIEEVADDLTIPALLRRAP